MAPSSDSTTQGLAKSRLNGLSKNDELMLLCISLILENMLRLNSLNLK
ncbi:hypothetical protein GXM_03754 [Nostoc sphaeroides CCNUC1]|uniref:Uncharacterized protein n=1 Tax=Nostoc sphaeroides CCNUC1 TaxID=2653204 RepID=A0A5P8W105_9NOSO|nr:hypothetical protein GXM_03754 [Nostoc sphaeroides CCNUC1]